MSNVNTNTNTATETVTTATAKEQTVKTNETTTPETTTTTSNKEKTMTLKEKLAAAKAKASEAAKASLEAAKEANKEGHAKGKEYVATLKDKTGKVIGFVKDATVEGLKAKIAYYGKAVVYYTIYAVAIVPAYVAGYLVGSISSLFEGKEKAAKQLEANAEKVEEGTIEYHI